MSPGQTAREPVITLVKDEESSRARAAAAAATVMDWHDTAHGVCVWPVWPGEFAARVRGPRTLPRLRSMIHTGR